MPAHTEHNSESRNHQILEDSVREHGNVIVTHRTDKGWRTWKSQFVSGSPASASLTVRVDPDGDDGPFPSLHPGDTLGVTFRAGHTKCMFSGVLESVMMQTQGAVCAMPWPRQIQRLQRRVYQRAIPPKSSVIPVRFWREPAGGTASGDPVVRYGQLEDLSAGGMRLQATEPGEWELDATYRCSFAPHPNGPVLVLEATLRHHEAADRGRASLGFQFIGLETTPEGRQALTRLARIVASFHQARP